MITITIGWEYLMFGPLFIAFVFILVGYVMGRNSAERPLSAQVPKISKEKATTDDPSEDYFNRELIDPEDDGDNRISTV